MTRLFRSHKGRHTRGSDATGWGRLAHYCADASRHPVVEPPFHRPVRRNPYAPFTSQENQ